jgi:hypothetical protein
MSRMSNKLVIFIKKIESTVVTGAMLRSFFQPGQEDLNKDTIMTRWS